MRTTRIILFILAASIAAACHPAKKAQGSDVSQAPVPSPVPSAPSTGFPFALPAEGMQEPGPSELAAIQLRYSDATMDGLKKGHFIYTQGACIGCHGAGSIYRFTEPEWKTILDDMALKANISDEDKEAVNRYILSVKGVQPK